VVPSAIEGFAGVTVIDTSTAAVTVRVVEPPMLVPGSVAEMLVEPIETLVARPWLPPALLTVATPVLVELQVAELVRSCVLPSLYVPVALKDSVVPSAIEGFVGVTSIETSTAAVTVNVVAPLMPLPESVAEMLVEPIETLVARPRLPPALLTVATPVLVELQVAEFVRSCVLPSL
jgi:hypothetical protein